MTAKPRKHFICQFEGCEKSLEGMRSHAIYCPNHRRSKAKPRKYHICQLDGCDKSLQGTHWNRKYCCEKHREEAGLQFPKYKAYLELTKLRRRKPREFNTCQLVGCNKSLEEIKGIGIKRKRKFCCDEHGKEAYRISQIKPRKYHVCQLDGCENSLEGMRSDAKHCCDEHACKASSRARAGTPEQKAYEKARYQLPERRAWRKARYKRLHPRVYYVCQLDGCEISLAGVKRKYCCDSHSDKAYKQSQEGKERNRINLRKRQSKKRELPTTFTVSDWRQCLEHFDQSCAYCQEPFGDTTPHQEHFIPLSLDGPYTPDNIVCACYVCNGSKRNYAPEDWCTPEQYERAMSYLVQQ